MDSEARAQFEKLGLALGPDDPETGQDEVTDVFGDNWVSLSAFLDVSTQWRVTATMAGLIWIGLDYPAVKIVLDHLKLAPHVFDDIRVLENAALTALNGVD